MESVIDGVVRYLVPVINNLGLLSLLAWAIAIFGRNVVSVDTDPSPSEAAGAGALFGLAAASLMQQPFHLETGIFADARGAPILLSGVVGGPVSAAVCTLIAAATRFALGGAGMSGGVIYIFVFGALGAVIHWSRRRKDLPMPRVATLVSWGIVATLMSMPVVLLLPDGKVLTAVTTLWPQIFAANIVGVALLGYLLQVSERMPDWRYAAESESELQRLESESRPAGVSVTSRIYGEGPLKELSPGRFDALVGRYSALLDENLESEVLRLEGDRISREVSNLVDELGRLQAGPRDLVGIHKAALKQKLTQDIPAEKARAYMELGRLLLLKVMGRLVLFYRAFSLTWVGTEEGNGTGTGADKTRKRLR